VAEVQQIVLVATCAAATKALSSALLAPGRIDERSLTSQLLMRWIIHERRVTKLLEARSESTPRGVNDPLAVIQMWTNVPFLISLSSSIAARLCSQCGMCCNGVIFHRVRLQVADSPKELAALGLKLKRKRGQHYFLQPCPAFRETHCSIYASRRSAVVSSSAANCRA
jgi:hypothetical protein